VLIHLQAAFRNCLMFLTEAAAAALREVGAVWRHITFATFRPPRAVALEEVLNISEKLRGLARKPIAVGDLMSERGILSLKPQHWWLKVARPLQARKGVYSEFHNN
jgi:hypothetical protein